MEEWCGVFYTDFEVSIAVSRQKFGVARQVSGVKRSLCSRSMSCDSSSISNRNDQLGIVRTGACEPNENAETGSFGEALGNERPTDGRGAGIDGLID